MKSPVTDFLSTHLTDFADLDVETLHAMGYAQELARRVSGFSNFAISFAIICILGGAITSFPTAIATGSGFGVAVGWLVGSLFAFIVAAPLAQIGSAYPTAGSLYHWSSILGGRGWGWVTAWINLIGLLFIVAAIDVGTYSLFKGLVATPFGLDTSHWGFREQTIAVVAITFTQGLINHFGIKATTLVTDLSAYLILGVALLLTITFLYWGASFDLSRLVTFINTTGEPGGGFVPEPRTAVVAFLIGLIYPIFTITGFDASAHISEETKNARVVVPLGILNSVFWSVAFGFVMVVSFILASPDLAATAKDGGDAWFNLFAKLPAPDGLKTILAIGIVAANYLSGLAALTSASRMIFAFSRDGGLPASGLWKRVSRRWRTPVFAIWLGVALAVAATLYTPAFAALAAGCALFLYVSYVMPIAAGLLTIGRSWTSFGPFTLGRWFKPIGALAVAGTPVLVYAGLQPPNHIVVNYLLGVIILMSALWLLIERRRFSGPPIGAAVAERQATIRREEQAVGEIA